MEKIKMNGIFYTANVCENRGIWFGWIEEIPGVNCQENSREELLKTLDTTLKEIIAIDKTVY
jgi:predicted RNase H-like HicB family nuclease